MTKSEQTAPALSTPNTNRRKLFVKSYGCQMNVYDAGRMADVLAPEGFDETAVMEEADLIILNTCHIRERASEKIFSELGKIRELKDEKIAQGGAMTIAVAGCVAQAEGNEIFRRQKAVDLVVGPQNYHRLPQLLRATRDQSRVLDTDFAVEDKFDFLTPPSQEKPARAASPLFSPFRKAVTNSAPSVWCLIRAGRKYRALPPKF